MDRIPQLSPHRLTLHNELFRSALSHAKVAAEHDLEASSAWVLLGAEIADSMGCEQLMSSDLEGVLLQLAAKISVPKRGKTLDQRRWLHVLSEAPTIGGHSALVARWIKFDRSQDRHNLVTTFQAAAEIPDFVHEAVKSKDGTIRSLSDITSLCERARLLREIAWLEADVVVLHTHMWDIIPVIAFGVPGGPPVLLLNHADHTFWVGAGIADLVINLRPSGEQVTRELRGIDRNAHLPIPLPLPDTRVSRTGESIRTELGIPTTAPLLLTVGSHFKYTAIGEVDFLETATHLLKAIPDAYLVAVGPLADDPDWKSASEHSNGRLIAVGPRNDIAPYFAAADVYLEGFPFGSLTALLEAALAGLTCIRAPKQCPPPFTSDGIALEHLSQPADLEDFVSRAVMLIASPSERDCQARLTREAIGHFHLGDGWQSLLDKLKTCIPAGHEIYPASAPRAPTLWEQYWWPFMARRLAIDPLLFFYVRGNQLGLHPRFSISLLITAHKAHVADRPAGMPGPIALGLFRPLIDPVATALPYGLRTKKRKWWPRIILDYWYARYIGWRFEEASKYGGTR